jgi:hypothetical protein
MFRRIRITPSTVIAITALVFAATGGAFAATNNNGGSGTPHATTASHTTVLATADAAKAKAKPKAKAGPRGPAGAAGKNGTNGTNGAPGATGPAGPAGGTGPAGGAGPTGPAGPEGKKGATGTTGNEGPPGAIHPGETLPSGASETGTWIVSTHDEGLIEQSFSFPIPLATPIGAGSEVHFLKPGEPSTEECPGTVENPEAKAGQFCVYAEELPAKVIFLGFGHAHYKSGMTASFATTENSPGGLGISASGTWAVTAE